MSLRLCFLTLIRVSSRFLHTSFLSADVMSDFFIRTRYLLKKSGYVHLEEWHRTQSGSLPVNFVLFKCSHNKHEPVMWLVSEFKYCMTLIIRFQVVSGALAFPRRGLGEMEKKEAER